ncbi:MAG TPA: hypothetical protein PK620_09405 [Denitromonas sp.]|uniref:hypothetical protein n=1 Tax=Denitromonas sp. TaxID=2734609 RepID=UPI001DFFCB8F|nr:hypothetical protein [Rhodocyclaceae bacterium]MCP5222324.1 hypothetical protein [Zoogloeaceae bacterium]HPR08727.1 hypothetical protein [Denitromonas sp.]HQU89400.1 hypothetical protein [Denitromonas sp.]HQV15120.1 hypothetical protein [Denitromonas sp.]
MGFTISLSECGQFVLCRVNDAITLALMQQAAIEASAFGDACHTQRFLFDVRGTRNVESVFRNYQFAHEELRTLGVNRAASFAVLIDADDRSQDFLETAVRNAGFDIRLFTDADKATHWLMLNQCTAIISAR